MSSEVSISHRQCNTCQLIKPFTLEFYRQSRNRSGKLYFYRKCRQCESREAQARYWQDADNKRAYSRERHKKIYPLISDKKKAISKAWREANPERVKAYKVNYRQDENNRRKQAANITDWRKRNPERARAISENRRTRAMQAEGTHTAADLIALYDASEDRCFYCGITLFGEYHVDHIQPLSRGGSNWPDNLACACPDCNLSKGDKTVDEWQAIRGW